MSKVNEKPTVSDTTTTANSSDTTTSLDSVTTSTRTTTTTSTDSNSVTATNERASPTQTLGPMHVADVPGGDVEDEVGGGKEVGGDEVVKKEQKEGEGEEENGVADELCHEITAYLETALQYCGESVLIETLYSTRCLQPYFDNVDSLHRRQYEDRFGLTQQLLDNVEVLRGGCVSMKEMSQVYSDEDVALLHWHSALSELYNYLIQPFLDLRESSLSQLRNLSGCCDSNSQSYIENRTNYINAIDQIQELYMDYFKTTSDNLSEQIAKMSEDKKYFGEIEFVKYAEMRFVRMTQEMHKERLQFFENKQIHFENQRDKKQQEMVSLLKENSQIDDSISLLEDDVYSWQLKMYRVQLSICQEKQLLYKFEIHHIQSNIDANCDLFFDAVEDLDSAIDAEIDAEIDVVSSTNDTLLTRLHRRRLHFQRKLVLLGRRRANIRNRMNTLKKSRDEKLKERSFQEKHNNDHHIIQNKLNQHKEESRRNCDFINKERNKTIERLRKYKIKYPRKSTFYDSYDYLDAEDPSDIDYPSTRSPDDVSLEFTDGADVGASMGFDRERKTEELVSCTQNVTVPTVVPIKRFAINNLELKQMRDLVFNKSKRNRKQSIRDHCTPPKAPALPSDNGKCSSFSSVAPDTSFSHACDKPVADRCKFKPNKAEHLDEMMRIIRAGVTLRPVSSATSSSSASQPRSPPRRGGVATAGGVASQSLVDRHTEQLRLAFARISERLRGSDDDEDDESSDSDSDFDVGGDYFD